MKMQTTLRAIPLLLLSTSVMAVQKQSLMEAKHMDLKMKGTAMMISDSAARTESKRIKDVMVREDEAKEMPCVDGLIADTFPCKNTNLLAFLTGEELGSRYALRTDPIVSATFVSDIWGWTDSRTGKEYAIVGMWDGTSFVDLSNPTIPKVVGFLETTRGVEEGLDGIRNLWKDAKVIGDVVYIGSEVSFHGIQAFDLTRLRTLRGGEEEVKILKPDYVADEVTSSHNVVAVENLNYIMAVGFSDNSPACKPGNSVFVNGATTDINPSMMVFDIGANPFRPKLKLCIYIGEGFEDSGYIHDAQCVLYTGPDERYTHATICALFMESEVALFNLDTFAVINTFTYDSASYVHQGWFSEDQTYLYGDDEVDEIERVSGGPNGDFSTTLIWDVSDLEAPPTLTKYESSPEDTHPHIDHNLYTKGDYIYQAAYTAGARVRKIDAHDPSVLTEVAFFDGDNLCETVFEEGIDCDPFAGTWTFFPYFDSGIAIAGSNPLGLYVIRPLVDNSSGSGCGSFQCPAGTHVGAHVQCLDALDDCFCDDTDDRADRRTQCWQR